jgi:hypothetical protein
MAHATAINRDNGPPESIGVVQKATKMKANRMSAFGQFNRAMKRNASRFPSDFAFQLTKQEWASLRCQIGSLKAAGRGRHSKYLPKVFTEHGAIMAATLLNSRRAVAMSVYVVRAFVKIRRELLANATLEKRLEHIEKILIAHDGALRDIYERIQPLLLPPPETPKRRIGFHTP